MKKTLLLAGLLLVVSASLASAAGISVNWGNDCWGDNPLQNRVWACNANNYTGVRMTCSFKPIETKATFIASDLYMEGMTEAAVVPDWWKLGSGECRSNLITLSSDGSVLGGPDCLDVWQGLGGGGIGLYSSEDNRMHVNAVWAVADAVEAPAETEIFAAQFRVATGKTLGTTACAGCAVPALWSLNYIQVGYLGEMVPLILDYPYAGGNQCLSWQSSSLPCAKPVPARNTTWGQVKSLYR
jgi:hypothetical protein